MCSRWYSHALAMLITASSALRPRQGAAAAWALCPLNLKTAEMRASAGSSPQEMPNSSLTCANRFTSTRSEEHTSELQSQFHLVCRLLLEKKNGEDIKMISNIDVQI